MDTDQLLKEEYFKIQDQIEKYDERALTIKAWSVTVSMAGIGTALHQDAPNLFWASALASLLFWSIEVYWKLFQKAFRGRAIKIEKYFSGHLKELSPLQISTDWSEEFKAIIKTPKTYAMIFYPHIMLPHVIVAVAGLLMFKVL